MAAVADHQDPFGQRSQLRQRVREHVGLGGANAVETGARDHLEVSVQAEMGEDALRRRLRLRGRDRQPHARRAQVGQQLGDPVEKAVHRPAPGGVVGAVRGDRRIGVPPSPMAVEGVVHRRSDDLLARSPSGTVRTDLDERVAEAGHDAAGRIGQGAVEVEDHQLGSNALMGIGDRACHVPIVADAAARR